MIRPFRRYLDRSIGRKLVYPLLLAGGWIAIICAALVNFVQIENAQRLARSRAETLVSYLVETENLLTEQGLLTRHLVHQLDDVASRSFASHGHLPLGDLQHSACFHRGEAVCRYEIVWQMDDVRSELAVASE